MDFYDTDRAALHVAVNGPMESRGSSSRELADDAIAFVDAHRIGSSSSGCTSTTPTCRTSRTPRCPRSGAPAWISTTARSASPTCTSGACSTTCTELGLWGHTAVVLTGDHGEGFGEHGVTEHGFDLYTAQTRVPFIVRVPGLPGRVAAPAGHIDIAPTLVNLARGQAEPTFIGRSLVPDLVGARAADADTRAVFQEVTSERGKKRALVTTRRHLIWNWVAQRHDRVLRPRARSGGDARPLGRGGRSALRGPGARAQAHGRGARAAAGRRREDGRRRDAAGRAAPRAGARARRRLGEAIAVRGYDVPVSEARPGDTLEVVTYFTVQQRLGEGWRIFFHLEGPVGGFRNLDHVPVEGLMPLARWRPGQQIRDRFKIALPAGTPPGLYTLYVGAYHAGERLPVTPPALADARGRLRLLQFTVRP